MLHMSDHNDSPVLLNQYSGLMTLTLNRPRVLNTLNLDMIRGLRRGLESALADDHICLVLISGAGERGFCAGGDLKELTRAVTDGAIDRADQFFREEYALDLKIHQFPKPVVVLVHGITMGGGLGLAAGADLAVATEATRMAMPETRIGFFPDVGATGWLFAKCPPGYPEYLTLTGYELAGPECVRLGLATHLVPSARLPELRRALESCAAQLPTPKPDAVKALRQVLTPFVLRDIPAKPELDAWVREHFAGKNSLKEILAALNQCGLESQRCEDVFCRLGERSPTALAVTLQLLRANAGRPLPEVFAREALAARFMITHPDYLEGIRARIIDKDDQPRWQPATLAEVGTLAGGF
jgi:enoyl-CoA hydratase